MSWGLQNECYNCPRKEECSDREFLEKGIYDKIIWPIHQNPEHPNKGGYGVIKVNCNKREDEIIRMWAAIQQQENQKREEL